MTVIAMMMFFYVEFHDYNNNGDDDIIYEVYLQKEMENSVRNYFAETFIVIYKPKFCI